MVGVVDNSYSLCSSENEKKRNAKSSSRALSWPETRWDKPTGPDV